MKKSLLGRVSDLTVTRLVDFGAYLDGGEEFGDILLPTRYIGTPLSKGDTVKVFVYRDSEDRLIATTQLPRAAVGEFAMLRVVDVNRAGAFLDWGLPKDLLVPYREQLTTMHPGEEHIIYIYVDNNSGRIVASSRLGKFLDNVIPRYRHGDRVSALVYRPTPIGWQVIVDNLHSGMIYYDNLDRDLEPGQTVEGRVRHVRPDGKIDLTMNDDAADRVATLCQAILDRLDANGGKLPFGDKSSPEAIAEAFGCSKRDFKHALGALYKQGKIQAPGPDSIQAKS